MRWMWLCVMAACAGRLPTVAAPPADVTGEWDVRWDRTWAGWQPPIFEGTLRVEGGGGGMVFRQTSARLELDAVRVAGDRVQMAFHVDGRGERVDVAATVRDGRMSGELRWGDEVGWTPFAARRYAAAAMR